MKKNTSIVIAGFLGLLGVLTAGCGEELSPAPDSASHSDQATRIDVFASIPPVAFLVEEVGGEHVDVQVLLQPGQEPHTFEPTPKQMAALAKARQFFIVGTLPFESALSTRLSAAADDLRVVNLSESIMLRDLEAHDHEEHGHEGHAHHHEASADPHVWLGPGELRIMAGNVSKALSEAMPRHAEDFARNLNAFEDATDEADARAREALAPFAGETVFVFHPAFGYFANAYGLHQMPVEIQGKRPRPRQIQALVQEARDHDARVLFVQPQFDAKSAQAIAEAIGAVLVPVDPLAKDVLSNLDDIASKLEQALKEQTPSNEQTHTAEDTGHG